MFERVRLITGMNAFVATVVIPRFTPPADVLIWGDRCFIFRVEDKYGQKVYREGMMWPVLPQEQYEGMFPDDKS